MQGAMCTSDFLQGGLKLCCLLTCCFAFCLSWYWLSSAGVSDVIVRRLKMCWFKMIPSPPSFSALCGFFLVSILHLFLLIAPLCVHCILVLSLCCFTLRCLLEQTLLCLFVCLFVCLFAIWMKKKKKKKKWAFDSLSTCLCLCDNWISGGIIGLCVCGLYLWDSQCYGSAGLH